MSRTAKTALIALPLLAAAAVVSSICGNREGVFVDSKDEPELGEPLLPHSFVSINDAEELELPTNTELATYRLFTRGQTNGLERIGSAFLGCTRGGNYVLVTAAHVARRCNSTDDMVAFGTGIGESGERTAIEIDGGDMVFAGIDTGHDVIACDVTERIERLTESGVRPACIDFGALPDATNWRTDIAIHGIHVGLAKPPTDPHLHFQPSAVALCPKADGEWTRRKGYLTGAAIEKTFSDGYYSILFGIGGMTDTVYEFLGGVNPGDSGSPVYAIDYKNRTLAIGMVVGMEPDYFYALPMDYVIGCVERTVSEINSRITSDDELMLRQAEEIALSPGETDKIETVDVTAPDIRKIVLSFEGDCASDNALTIGLGYQYQDEHIKIDDIYAAIGWDNTSEDEANHAEPGRKRNKFTFHLNRRHDEIKFEVEDKEALSDDCKGGFIDWRECNRLCVSSKVQTPTNAKATLEIYALKPKDKE